MSFDLQPILKGELLRLRPLRLEDFHDLYAVASDPLIWEQHPIRDRYKEEVFQRFFREALESGGALIAIDSKDGQVIGSSRFQGYNKEKSEIEIGWTFLARSRWGGIYDREDRGQRQLYGKRSAGSGAPTISRSSSGPFLVGP